MTNRELRELIKIGEQARNHFKNILGSNDFKLIEEAKRSFDEFVSPFKDSISALPTMKLPELPKIPEQVTGQFRTLTKSGMFDHIEQMKKSVEGMLPLNDSVIKPIFPIDVFPLQEATKNIIGDALRSPIQNIAEEVGKVFSEAIQNVGLSFVKSMVEEISKFSEPLREFAIAIRENKEASDVLYQIGFVISPSMEKPFLVRLVRIYQANEKNKAIQTVISYYKRGSYRRLKDAIENWNDNPLFLSRMKIIKDALDAHCKKKFTLTIPTLLPIVEGVIHEFIVQKELSLNAKKKDDIKKALEHSSLDGRLSFHIYEGLTKYLNEVYQSKDFRGLPPKNKSKLNRHVVLHGRQINYCTERNSLRMFLILDALSVLLMIDEEEANKSKSKKRSDRTKKQIES